MLQVFRDGHPDALHPIELAPLSSSWENFLRACCGALHLGRVTAVFDDDAEVEEYEALGPGDVLRITGVDAPPAVAPPTPALPALPALPAPAPTIPTPATPRPPYPRPHAPPAFGSTKAARPLVMDATPRPSVASS